MSKSDAIEQEKQSQLYDLVDALVELANQATDKALDPGEAHQAMMYATARYGAFIVAASSESKEDYEQDKLDARNFYMDQFRQLLNENFDDYLANFDQYLDSD
ncbi:DUF3144 domain-containing protein [Halioxenophilus aromaticivorans]|uniref:DUF3144 domain-containing protein n=1 Tax=Halioxenophilus aromaticivorans TaxID=1306992 RepID=A0AAV3TZL2_9ALTE